MMYVGVFAVAIVLTLIELRLMGMNITFGGR